jgi:hypothetical protein
MEGLQIALWELQLLVVGVGDVSLLPPMLYLCFPNNVSEILD